MLDPDEVETLLASLGPTGDPRARQFIADRLILLRESDGWQLLMVQLASDAEQARDGFSEADPFDTNEIIRLQNRVKRFSWFAHTLDELIASAVNEEEIDAAEAEDIVEDQPVEGEDEVD